MPEQEADQLQVAVDINEIARSMAEMLDGSKDRRESRNEPWTIFRVGDEMRKLDPGAFDPKIVSIGPYHRGKAHLLPMEQIKLQFLDSLINRHPSNTLLNYINVVSNPFFLQEITKCYAEQVIGDDGGKVFVETMVLDGCFVIEFLVRYYLGQSMADLGFFLDKFMIVWADLLLIENQIPFRVLQVLFDSSTIPQLVEERERTITEIAAFVVIIRMQFWPHKPSFIPPVVHHLLHLHYSSFRPSLGNMSKPSQVRSVTREFIRKIRNIVWEYVFWVLSVLINCGRPSKYRQRTPTLKLLPSATELYKVGVTFKPTVSSVNMVDVTFSTVDGVMVLPKRLISPSTLSKTRNLITMEHYYPSIGHTVTSFVILMDNLIDTMDDVEILVRSGVLENKMESKDELLRSYSNLAKGAFLNYENHYFEKLSKDVNDYCSEERHEWWATLKHTYFCNPWTAIALFGAILALLLTILQTFYAVFAYHRPPNP